LFKRRKIDEPQVAEPPAAVVTPAPKPPEIVVDGDNKPVVDAVPEIPARPTQSAAPTTPPYPPGLLSKPAENGSATSPYRAASLKDQPMGRTPFATSPTTPPSIPQPSPSASPIRPTGLTPPSPRAMGVAETVERRTLVVGKGISVQGTVQDAERLVVEGTVEASMIHATELSISQGGVFKGEAEVEEAEVAGTIDGTLTARASLIIRATGKVIGTAKYRRLQVEDGGQISGKMEMLTEAPKPVESAA